MLSPDESDVLTRHVAMGFYFSPRGGSAQVARYLCTALDAERWAATLYSGSVGSPVDNGNAAMFFCGIDCRSLDYTAARADWLNGGDPMVAPVPMHASFEDKANVPDRILLGLDDDACRRQVRSWTDFLALNSARPPDVVHLHHLTPMHQAIQDLWPDVPIITHLHGTELKMLTLAAVAPSHWSSRWVERMRGWAAASQRLVVVSRQDHELAVKLLGVETDRLVTIANGVDTDVFSVHERSGSASRRAGWQEWLVDDPRGWKPGEDAGSIRYRQEDLAAFDGDDGDLVPVVLFAGRFMQFKRLQLLIEAHEEMQRAGHPPCVLVIAGGYPGEWEGEHPYDTVQRLGARNVFFLGWRDHHHLAEILGCVDVFAAPSVDEPFGLVYLEAMAAGVAPIATATGGPLSFINVDPQLPTGWLVAPDDRGALVAALVEAVSDREQLSSRGKRAAHFVGEHYSWSQAARSFEDLYDTVIDETSLSALSR